MATDRSDFLRGCRAAWPIMVAAGPFGLLFGALAVDNGMSIAEAVFMSATVFAGASQMVGIDLFGQKIAPWLIVFSIFAVNFRHILYSAAIGRHIRHWTLLQKAAGFFLLTDPQFAVTEQKGEAGEKISFAWYMGMGIPIYLAWVLEGLIGALFGRLISNPDALGLDLLLPIYFMGLVLSFRKRANWTWIVMASGVASVVAYHYVGAPWHVSLGAAAGILVAAIFPPHKDGEELEDVVASDNQAGEVRP